MALADGTAGRSRPSEDSNCSRSTRRRGDIGRHGGHGGVDALALVQHRTDVPAILHQAVGAPVAAHLDEGHHVDEEPRVLARHESGVEEVDLGRHLGQDGFEHLAQEFEPRQFRVAEVAERLGAIGHLHPCGPDRRRQARGPDRPFDRPRRSVPLGRPFIHADPPTVPAEN